MSSQTIKQHYLQARKTKRSLTNIISAVDITVPFFAKVLDNGQMSTPIHKQLKQNKCHHKHPDIDTGMVLQLNTMYYYHTMYIL